MNDGLIVQVLQHYYPDWTPPASWVKPYRHEWNQCLCPFHGEENPSAAVSYERNAFRCHACDAKGDAFSIIALKEGISYREAHETAAAILGRSSEQIPQSVGRLKGRRVFASERDMVIQPAGRTVSSRLRRRTFGRA